MKDLTNKVVVITGAGSGIGREMALLAARKGALLAISDWNETGLAESTRLCSEAGCSDVLATQVDVSDRNAVAAWAEEVMAHFGRVNMMVNNAGVTYTGDFTDMDYEDFDWIVGINFYGVIHGTKEFLPHLIASGDGALVNISSLFGLLSVPGQGAYNATKYAVRGFSEALRGELLIAKAPVTLTVVHPGGIRTGISRNGRKVSSLDDAALDRFFDKKLARMDPDQAAQIIMKGALAGKPRVLVGIDAHVFHNLTKLAGARYQDVLARLMPAQLKKKTPAAP